MGQRHAGRGAGARPAAARYPSAMALWHALEGLETQAKAAREASERAAVAAQWKVDAEAALAAGELGARTRGWALAGGGAGGWGGEGVPSR